MSFYAHSLFWIYIVLWNYCGNGQEQTTTCDPPWEPLSRSCILFVKDAPHRDWQKARDYCVDVGADLLAINNEAERQKLRQLLIDHVKSMDLLYWWIGLKLSTDGTWYWTDQEQLNTNVIDWAPMSGGTVGEDGILKDRCGLLDYQGYLKDESCLKPKPFICEKISVVVTPVVSTTPKTTSRATTAVPSPPSPEIKAATKPPVPTPTSQDKKTSEGTDKPTSGGSNAHTTNSNTGYPTRTNTNKFTDSTGQASEHPNGKPTDLPTKPTDKPNSNNTGKPSDITAGKPTDKVTGRPTDKPTAKPTDKQTGRPTDKQTGRPTDEPTTGSVTLPPDSSKYNQDDFLGCYAVNLESTCPPVEAFGISWPRTQPGKMAFVPCDKGQAKWKCNKNPTCWRDEPDVKQCTSEAIQDLTKQAASILENPENSELALEFTENLASASGSGQVLSEQDIYQSTKLMSAAAQTRPKDPTEAKNIIQNVAKCGSNLVASDKKTTWSSMSPESQRTVASSLLNSMENVSKQMLASFDMPAIENIKEENMALQLQVVNVTDPGPDPKPIEYGESSNNFAIPLENLQRFSTGGLARLVFISYSNIGQVLKPENNSNEQGMVRELVSQVVSASIGDKPVGEPLANPITFTMNTQERSKEKEWKQMCSFWNFSLGYTGAWSQQGCTLKKYNDTHTICECDHLTNFAVLMDIHSTKLDPVHATTLSYITYVGLIISIVCLFLSWVTFVCLSIRCLRRSRSSLGMGEANEYYGSSGSGSGSSGSRSAQGERNSIHKHLVFCLFVAEILFLAGIERTDNKIACAVIAGLLHYFFMAGFTWMFVEGIHILFMLVQVFDAAKSRLKYYYLIGYGVPLIICGVSALVYYEGYGTEKYCWLTNERMFIWSFAGPVAFILLVNLVILIYAMSAVCKHAEYVFTKEKSAGGNIKAWIQGAMALEVLLGLTWIFGYFYISEEALPMAYLFTIFNSLQGLFIFIFHCILNKKVRKEYERFISYPRRPSSSATNSSSKGQGHHHANGSGPHTHSYNMNGVRKSSAFVDLSKDRRQSTKSTTSA